MHNDDSEDGINENDDDESASSSEDDDSNPFFFFSIFSPFLAGFAVNGFTNPTGPDSSTFFCFSDLGGS